MLILLVLMLLAAAPAWALEQTSPVIFQSGATANGDGTTQPVSGYATLGLDIAVTNTATVTIKGRSTPSGSFSDMRCTNSADGSASASFTASANITCAVAGIAEVKAVISSCSSCTVTAAGRITTASSGSGGGGGGGGSSDTELPAAAALADNTANPTVPGVAAFLMCYDGATWDRCQGGLTDTDDGTITAAQVPTLALSLPYAFNGTDWKRPVSDPCGTLAKTYLPINISTATTTEITPSLAGASTHYYVCSINIGPVAGAQNVALVDDDSDGCGSVTSGLAGGTTAGSGWNIAANGGLVLGNGASSVARTGGTNRVLCLVTSAAVQTSGVMTVVAAP